MKRNLSFCLGVVFAVTTGICVGQEPPATTVAPALATPGAPAAAPAVPPLPAATPAFPALATAGPVYVVPVHDEMNKAMLFSFRRAFREAEEVSARAIVLDIDTPGGGIRETEEMLAWIRAAKVPVVAFVNPRALSAGAILSLGTRRIFMAPGSRIGSAMPIVINPLSGGIMELPGEVKEKMLSNVRSLVRELAQENGYNQDLAMAMVDATHEAKIGGRVIAGGGKLLNLTVKEATEIIPPMTRPLLAEAELADLNAVAKHLGAADAQIMRYTESPSERLARFLCLIGPLLLALGLLGIYVEFKTPGVILPGILGGVCLALYFFGHHVAGLAGFEEILLVVAGLVLIGLEIFLFPGVGVLAVAGIFCVVGGLVMGLVPYVPKPPPGLPEIHTSLADYLTSALWELVITGGIILGGTWLLSKILPKTPLYGALVLRKELTPQDGFVSHTAARYEKLAGHTGTAVTLLRPAGTAEIDGRRCDVVSNGGYIEAGARIRVIQIEGSRIVVEAVAAESAEKQP